MNEEPIIRRAAAADYSGIKQLLSDAGLPLDGLLDNSAGHEKFLVLCREGSVVGCAAVERYGKFGLLRSVALEPLERRHGLGRRLVQETLQRARREGIAEVVLLTTTAARFFERLGFHAIRREEVPASVQSSVEFQSVCPDTATVMHVALR